MSAVVEKPVYSVVVPVYNSTESLQELHRRITEVFSSEVRKSHEIIFVDDASPSERTWKTLTEIQERDCRVRIIRLMKNSGQHNATLCGLRYSLGNFVITLDDDLQHPPEEIPKLIALMNDSPHLDAVLATPERRSHKAFRNIGSRLLNKMISVAIQKPEDITLSSYRLLNRQLVEAITKYTGPIVTVGSLICLTTQRIVNLNIRHENRSFGKSNYSLPKLISLALANVFNFSAFPLQVISAIGFLSSFFAISYALWIVYLRLIGSLRETGFATIVVLISFFSGTILFAFGILGQYIIRILRGVSGGTQYTVREKRGWVDEETPGFGSHSLSSADRQGGAG